MWCAVRRLETRETVQCCEQDDSGVASSGQQSVLRFDRPSQPASPGSRERYWQPDTVRRYLTLLLGLGLTDWQLLSNMMGHHSPLTTTTLSQYSLQKYSTPPTTTTRLSISDQSAVSQLTRTYITTTPSFQLLYRTREHNRHRVQSSEIK